MYPMLSNALCVSLPDLASHPDTYASQMRIPTILTRAKRSQWSWGSAMRQARGVA